MHARYARHQSSPSYHSQHSTSSSSSPQYTSKYSSAYDGYSSPVKPTTTSYQPRSYAEYYPSPSSPTTYYNSQQQHHHHHHQSQPYQQQHTKYYPSGASTASSSSQEGPFYADELDELDDYNMGMASADMTTIPTVPTPMKLSKYELGKTPSGRVMVTAGNQTVEFFLSVANAPLSRCMIVHE